MGYVSTEMKQGQRIQMFGTLQFSQILVG